LFNAFTPLVLKGNVKKVIAISSGHADLDFINQTDIESSTLYASNKAALNVIVAKYSAQYKKDGVLFMTMSPGVVDVGHFDNSMYCIVSSRLKPHANSYLTVPPEVMAGMQAFATKLHVHAPHFKGPATAPDSVKDIISTWERASIETGYGGAFVSHFGNKQWV
jgi:NAD(P)-dependent dehydrogenase (short-subunit alcohol dehydrogenase family)